MQAFEQKTSEVRDMPWKMNMVCGETFREDSHCGKQTLQAPCEPCLLLIVSMSKSLPLSVGGTCDRLLTIAKVRGCHSCHHVNLCKILSCYYTGSRGSLSPFLAWKKQATMRVLPAQGTSCCR